MPVARSEPLFPEPAENDEVEFTPIDHPTKEKAELQLELRRQQEELGLLEQIRRALLISPDMSKVFPIVVDTIAANFSFALVSIYLLEHGKLHLQAQVGYADCPEIISLNQGVQGRVARSGQSAFIQDVNADPDYLSKPANPTRSKLCVPLMGRGREVLGTLGIESGPGHPLSLLDLKLCLTLAEHIVLALEQSRLYRSEQRRANQLALLNQIGRDLTSTLDVETIIARVIGPIRQKLGYYSVNIGLVEGAELAYRISLPSEGTSVTTYSYPLEVECLSTHCVKTGEMLVVRDTNEEPLYKPYALLPDTRSEVIVPLRSGEQVIGVLDIESDRVNAFDDDDIILLKTLADETCVALENARRFEQLQSQSAELNRTNQKLAQANRLKSEFLANVSHELRTPLNSIIGYVDMIESGYYGEISEAMTDPLERVARNGHRLLALINDVLDLSNIEAGRFEIIPEFIVLADMLRATCTNFEQQAQGKGLEFRLQLAADLPRLVRHDPRRLHQILSNLLSNAVKFTQTGQIEVKTGLEADKSHFFIQVCDSGIGIPESEFEHIFEEFRQVDGSTTRQYGGTGLGLALASRTCEMMGGKIRVNSVLGQGSIFTLSLPQESLPLVKENPAQLLE